MWWQFAEASSVDAILALIPGELSLFIVVLFWKIELIYCHSYVLFLLHRFVFQLLITGLIDAKDPYISLLKFKKNLSTLKLSFRSLGDSC